MKKTLIVILLPCYIGILLHRPALASEEFETSHQVRFEVGVNGQATVHQEITLTNKLSTIYASHYSLSIPGGTISQLEASDSHGPLQLKTQPEDKTTKIDFFFNEPVVGKDQSLTFQINYQIDGLVKKNGQAWEVTFPRLSTMSEIDHYSLVVATPLVFGESAQATPSPDRTSQEEKFNLFYFTREQLLESEVNLVFGQFQLFDFVLNYHLENPEAKSSPVEIALPPDTAFQRVFYSSITPRPQTVFSDEDGNWLARYLLPSREKIKVVVVGKAQIFSQPLKFPAPLGQESLEKNLWPQKYWETDHPLVKQNLGSLRTPYKIYQLVVERLEYDYSRAGQATGRLGALGALKNPHQALCSEFTDLFVTLSRAAGTPAREINGYAWVPQETSETKALTGSLLHAWPEYWDERRQLWVPIDPTWGKTTGGRDFFNQVDFNRVVLTIHGISSESPYSEAKEIQVVFGKYEGEQASQYEVNFNLPGQVFSGLNSQGEVTIYNSGPKAVYDQTAKLEAKDLLLLSPSSQKVVSLLPFSSATIPLEFTSQGWLGSGRGELELDFAGQKYQAEVKVIPFFWRFIFPPFLFLLLVVATAFVLKKKKNAT